MNIIVIDGSIATYTKMGFTPSGKVFMKADILINGGASKCEVIFVGAKLCDKFEAFAKRKLDVIVTGRLFSSQRTGGLAIYADDIGFINAYGKSKPMTAEMAVAQRTTAIEEEMVEIDETVL